MNPTTPLSGVDLVRVPQDPGNRRRRQRGADEQFRRALQERGADLPGDAAEPPAKTPATPTPRALQRQPAASRREPGTPARHVDLLA